MELEISLMIHQNILPMKRHLQEIVKQVGDKPFINQALSPLNVILGEIGSGQTLDVTLQNQVLGNFFPNADLQARTHLEESIERKIKVHDPVIVTTRLYSLPNEGFFLEISVKKMVLFSVTDFTGLDIPLNNNTKFPVFLELDLQWSVPTFWSIPSNYPPTSLSLTVKGKSEIVGWTASFSQGMLSGYTEGVLGLSIDLPNSASVSIATWIFTPHGLLVNTISGENLGGSHPVLNIKNYGDASDALMAPSQALTAFQMPPRTNQIFDGPYHVKFPLHTDEVFSLSTVENWLTGISRWFSMPMIKSPALVSTLQFCIAQHRDFDFEVSINQKPSVACSVNVGGRLSLDSEASNFNNRLAACGLNTIFFVEGIEVSYDNRTCGAFLFRPRVPGSIWSFEMNDTSVSKFLPSNTTRFNAQSKPLFSNWYDFAQLMNVLLPDLSVTPVFTTKSLTTYPYLIPADIQSYFPNDVRSVGFQLKLSNVANVQFPPTSTVSSPAGNVVVNFNNESLQPLRGTLTTNYSFGINAMLTGLPFGGGNGICVLSDISGDPLNQTVEIGKNKFTVTIYAYRRNKTEFENLQHSQEIVLTPFHKFYASLRSYVINSPDLPDWVHQIWKIRVATVDSPTKKPVRQVFLCLNRSKTTDGKLVIPLGISISYSSIPYLANSSLIPGRGSISVSDFKLNAVAQMSASQVVASGVLGVVPYTSDGNIILKSNISYSIKTHKDMIPLATLTKASQDKELFKYFKTNVVQDASLTMKVALDPFVPIGGFPSKNVQLYVTKEIELGESDDDASKSSKFEDMLIWNARFLPDGKKRDPISDAAAKNLLNFQKNLPKLSSFLAGLQNQLQNLLNFPLPLIPNSLDDLYQKVLGKYFTQFNNLISSTPDLTIPFFCQSIDNVFKDGKKDAAQKICKFIDVKEETLSFDLSFVIGNMVPTQFKFDSQTFLNTKLPLPQALGPIDKTQLEMLANFSITLIAKITTSGDVSVSMKPGSKMELSVSAGFTGALNAGFGVFPVVFSGLNGKLGPVMWTTTVKEDGKSFSNTFVGSCDLSSSLSINKRGICSLSLQIPDITKLTQPNGFNFTADCGDGENLVDTLIDAMKSSSLVDILLDATQFTNRFTSAIQSVVDFLLRGTNVLQKVPLIGPPLRQAVEGELRQIMGPDQTKALVARIRRFYTEQIDKLTSQKRALPDDIEDLLLGEIVRAVSDILHIPQVSTPLKDGKFDWFLGFKRTIKKPLKGFDFELGKHGGAGFTCKSDTHVEINFAFNLTLHFDKVKGISTSYPEVPFRLTALTDLKNDLSGKLGFIGAEIDTEGIVTVELSISNQWRPTISFKAGLDGDAFLGMAGLAKELGFGKSSFKALPQFKASISLGWNATWAPGGASPAVVPPTFKMRGVGVCLGQLFGETLLDISKTVKEKILEPFDDVVGPDGLLMTEIEIAHILFGRQMNFAELFGFVAQFLCSEEDDCVYENVANAIEAWTTVARQIQDFVYLLSLDDGGCNIVRMIGDMDLDFSKDKPLLSRKRMVEGDFDLNLGPGFEDKREALTKVFNQFDKDEWGVIFHLRDNIPEALLSLLLGNPIPIVGVRIPRLSIGTGISWTIPIWAPPQINLIIGIEASFTVDVGEIVYTSQGITDAIRTKSPGKLLNGLAISTIQPDGTPRYIIVIRVKFSAGLEVSIFFARAEANVYIIIEAKARLVGITDSPYVPFSEIGWILVQNDYNPLALFEKRLTVTLGFGIRIRFCFFIGCITIWSWKYEIVLFDITFPAGNRPPTIADDQARINAKAIGIGMMPDTPGIPTMRIYDALDGAKRTIDYMAGEGANAVSKIVSAKMPVGLSGVPGQSWRLELLGVRNRINLPSNLEKATVFLDFPDAETVHLTRDSLFPDGFAASVLGLMKALEIDRSSGFGIASLTGTPGPVKIIGSTAAQVLIAGTENLYTGGSVTIEGAASLVDASIRSTSYDIAGALIKAGNLGINLPSDVAKINAQGDLNKPSTYRVADVPAMRSITVLGGAGDDLFTIPALQSINGLLQLTGGGGINSIELTLDAKFGKAITISPSSVFMDGGSDKHLVKWEAVQARNIELHGYEKTQVAIINPEAGSLLQVTSVGTTSTNIEQRISGCNQAADVRITMKGGGVQTIIIGNNQKILGFACTVRVTGSSDKKETDVIIIEAGEETRAMSWLIDEGSLQVYPTANNDNWFKLIFTDIERVQITFGEGGNSLDFAHALDNECEYFFDFGKKPTTENHIRIQQSRATILMVGYIHQLGIGPVKTPQIQAPNPLSLIYGMVTLTSKVRANITMNSGVGPKAPVQHIEIVNDCIFNYRLDGSRDAVGNPTTWMCGLIKSNGLPASACTTTCPVKFIGNPGIILETGNQNDRFAAKNVKALLDIDLGPGNDIINYGPSHPTTLNSYLNLGQGVDTLNVYAPIAAATANLGIDNDYDFVQVYPGEFRAGVEKRAMQRIGPLSPTKSDYLTVQNINAEDIIDVSANTAVPSGPIGASAPIIVSAPTPGGLLRVTLQTDTTYDIQQCASQAIIYFESPAPATKWNINVSLPNWHVSCLIKIFSTAKSQGVLNLNVKNVNDQFNSRITNDLPFSVVDLGAVTIQVQDVMFLGVNSPSNALTLRTDGTPTNSELFILTKAVTSELELAGIKNHVVVINGNINYVPIMMNVSVTSVGNQVRNTINTGASTEVRYAAGCLGVGSQVTIPSSKLVGLATAYGVPRASNCIFFTSGTTYLDVTTSKANVSVSGILKGRTASDIRITSSHLTLTDTETWQTATITGPGTLLAVDSRYKINFIGSELIVNSNVIGNATRLSIDTKELVQNLIIGQDILANVKMISWIGTAKGHIFLNKAVLPTQFKLVGPEISLNFSSPLRGKQLTWKSSRFSLTDLSILSTDQFLLSGRGILNIDDLILWNGGLLDFIGIVDITSTLSLKVPQQDFRLTASGNANFQNLFLNANVKVSTRIEGVGDLPLIISATSGILTTDGSISVKGSSTASQKTALSFDAIADIKQKSFIKSIFNSAQESFSYTGLSYLQLSGNSTGLWDLSFVTNGSKIEGLVQLPLSSLVVDNFVTMNHVFKNISAKTEATTKIIGDQTTIDHKWKSGAMIIKNPKSLLPQLMVNNTFKDEKGQFDGRMISRTHLVDFLMTNTGLKIHGISDLYSVVNVTAGGSIVSSCDSSSVMVLVVDHGSADFNLTSADRFNASVKLPLASNQSYTLNSTALLPLISVKINIKDKAALELKNINALDLTDKSTPGKAVMKTSSSGRSALTIRNNLIVLEGISSMTSDVVLYKERSLKLDGRSSNVIWSSTDLSSGDFNLTGALHLSVVLNASTGLYNFEANSLEPLISYASNLIDFPHFDLNAASTLDLFIRSLQGTLTTQARAATALSVTTRNDTTSFTGIHSMTFFLRTQSETSLEIGSNCTSQDPTKCPSVPGSNVNVDFTKGTLTTNNTEKNLVIWNNATKFYSDLYQSGTFGSSLALTTSKIEVSGVGFTDSCSFISPNGHIIVNTSKTKLSVPIPLATIVSPQSDSISLNGHHIKVSSLIHSTGEFNITTTGQQLKVNLNFAGINSFVGTGRSQINSTLWSIPEIIDNKRDLELQKRIIEINDDKEFRVLTVPNDVEFIFSDGFWIETLDVDVRDGDNTITLTGPLIPSITLGPEAVTFLRSVIPINIILPNDLTYDPLNTTIHPSQQDSESCIQPRVVCTKNTWNELSVTTLTKLPCNSKLAQLNESCLPDLPNMHLDTSGSPFSCFINDLNESTGWNISVNPTETHEFLNGTTGTFKIAVVSIYALHMSILVIGYVAFGTFATEGWMVIAITSFLPRAIPAEGWSTSALAIVSSAKFIVRDWWITLTDDGAGVCNSDLSQMVVGWLVIGFAALTILLLILRQYKRGEEEKEYIRKIQIGIDVLTRLFVVLGIFWLAIPVISHLPIPESSTPYIGFILLVMLCSVLILFFVMLSLSTQKPRWMRDPPGILGYSIFSRSYVNYLFLTTMLLFSLTPGIMGHPFIDADGLPTTVFSIILVAATAILFLIKSFLLWKEYTTPRHDDDDVIDYAAPSSYWTHRCLSVPTIPSIFLILISFIYVGLGTSFIVLFSSWPYFDDKVFLALWMAWAGPISLLVSIFAFFPYCECNAGPKDEQEIELKAEGYQQY